MARLGELVEQIRGVSYKPSDLRTSDDNDGVMLLRANNIQDGEIVLNDVLYVSKDKINKKQYLRKGDILVCTSSGSKDLVGKAAFVADDLPCVFGAFCKVVRPRVDYPKYIGYFFQSPYYRNRISDASAGANINNLRTEHIDDLTINMPSLDEQRKIAAVLDKISDLAAKRRRQLDKLDELVKSRFVEMFGDPVINEKNWPKYKISDFATVKIGPFGSMLHADDYVRGGHPMVNPSHISDGVIIPDFSLSLNVQKQEELVAYQLLPGDVIIGRRGEIARCAVVKKSGMFCGTGCMFVRIFKDCRPDYLQRVISYPTFSSILEDKAVGVTMKNLNAGMVEDSNVYLPPLSMQDKFASFRAQVDTLKLRIGSSVDKLDTLKKSLMQEYFSVR